MGKDGRGKRGRGSSATVNMGRALRDLPRGRGTTIFKGPQGPTVFDVRGGKKIERKNGRPPSSRNLVGQGQHGARQIRGP